MTENITQAPLLIPERIQFLKKIESKKCAFDALTDLLVKGQKSVTRNEIFDALISREKLGSTTIGSGIAVPKAHLDINNPRAALLVVKKGLDLGAADKLPVTFFLAVIIPEQQRKAYGEMLNKFNRKLILNELPETALSSKNSEQLIKFLDKILQQVLEESPLEGPIEEQTKSS